MAAGRHAWARGLRVAGEQGNQGGIIQSCLRRLHSGTNTVRIPMSAGALESVIGNILVTGHKRRSMPKRGQDTGEQPRLTASDEELYSERHKFPGFLQIRQLLQKGAILEAMTRFHLACQHWERVVQGKVKRGESDFEISPHITNQLIWMLSRLAASPSRDWNGSSGQTTPRECVWIPEVMVDGMDVRKVGVPSLSVYGLASVHDTSISLGILPSSSSMAAALFALSKNVDVDTFTRCVVLLLLQLSGHSAQVSHRHALDSASVTPSMYNFGAFPPVLLASILDGYARFGMPQLGEELLSHWASGVATSKEDHPTAEGQMERAWQMATDAKRSSLPPPVWVNCSGWASEMSIWTALVRGRSSAHDLAGARHWLQRYRSDGLAAVQARQGKDCGGPHVEYINACTKIRRNDIDADVSIRDRKPDEWMEGGKARFSIINDSVKLMYQDGAALPDNLFTTLLNVQIGYGKIEQALGLIHAFVDKNPNPWPASFFKALFHLHTKMSVRQLKAATYFATLSVGYRWIGELRAVFRRFVHSPAFQRQGGSTAVRVKALNEALRASLAAMDLPLSLHILETFKAHHIPVDSHTRFIVVSALDPHSRRNARHTHRERMRKQLEFAPLEETEQGMNEGREPNVDYETTVYTFKPPPLLESERDGNNGSALACKFAIGWRIVDIVRLAMEEGPHDDDPEWVRLACQSIDGSEGSLQYERVLEAVSIR